MLNSQHPKWQGTLGKKASYLDSFTNRRCHIGTQPTKEFQIQCESSPQWVSLATDADKKLIDGELLKITSILDEYTKLLDDFMSANDWRNKKVTVTASGQSTTAAPARPVSPRKYFKKIKDLDLEKLSIHITIFVFTDWKKKCITWFGDTYDTKEQ